MVSPSASNRKEIIKPDPLTDRAEVDVIPGRLNRLIKIIHGERARETVRAAAAERLFQPEGGNQPTRNTMDAICKQGGRRRRVFVQAICDALNVEIEIVLSDFVASLQTHGVVWDDTITTPEQLRAYAQRAMGVLEQIDLAASQPRPAEQFDSYVAEKEAGFVGRRDIAAEIKRFLDPEQNRAERGYFVVEGEPGVGKTALIARLIGDHQFLPGRRWTAHHFNRRAIGCVHGASFVANICAQLANKHRATYLSVGEQTATARHLLEALDTITHHDRFGPTASVLIAIDALDEAEAPQDGQNTLGLPETLPRGVFVIATARSAPNGGAVGNEPYRLRVTGGNTPLHIQSLAQDGQQNRRDVEEYLAGQNLPATTSRKIAELAAGNFMVASLLVGEIGKGDSGLYPNPSNPDWRMLPEGLLAYFQLHLEMIIARAEANWSRLYHPILASLALRRDAADLEFMQHFVIACLPRAQQADIEGDRSARLALTQEIRQALGRIGQFLTRTGPPNKPGYRLYHPLFTNFIAGHSGLDMAEMRQVFIERYKIPPDKFRESEWSVSQ